MSAESDDWNRVSTARLKRMDEETARQTLTVAEYERWEGVQELHQQADEQREAWRDHDDTALDVAVHADLNDLWVSVELYGNTLEVYADPEDDELQSIAEELQSEFDDVDPEDIDDFDTERVHQLGHILEDYVNAILKTWNGTRWSDLPQDKRIQILTTARDRWGTKAMALGLMKCASKMAEQQEDYVEAVESFRGTQRRGVGRNT